MATVTYRVLNKSKICYSANNTDWKTGARFNLFKADFFAIREKINQILVDCNFSGVEQVEKQKM